MFITLEGIEGCGKTTLLKNLAGALQNRHYEVLTTREPGGCTLGQALRTLLLKPGAPISTAAELLLFLADRAQHTAEIIRPALKRGCIVLCDRYADSTIVYQGYGRGFDIPTLQHLHDIATGGLWPDITLVLDMDPAEALARARSRNQTRGTADAEGRFEAENMLFHARIREGFLHWAAANPGRIIVLDAAHSPKSLLQQALDAAFTQLRRS